MAFDEADVRRASDGTFTAKNGSAPEVSIDYTPQGEELAIVAARAVLNAWQPGEETRFNVHEPAAPGRDWHVEFYEPDGSVKYTMDLGPEGVPTRVYANGKPLDPEHQNAVSARNAVYDALQLPYPNYGQRKRAERYNFEGRALYTHEGAGDLMDAAGEYVAKATTLREVDEQQSAFLNAQPPTFAEPGTAAWKEASDRQALALRAAEWQSVRRTRELRFSGERHEYSRLPDRNEFRDCGNRVEIAARIEELNENDPPSYQRGIHIADAVDRALELEN